MTTLILVPGFWLDASSWNEVTPPLEAAGHDVRPLTLPGLESPDSARSRLRLADHVDAVVGVIDSAEEPVVLVGHSGGGTVVHAAVDQRPERVSRVVYVDTGPTPAGVPTNADIPDENGEIPLPEWDAFEGELADFTDDQLDAFRERAIAHPAGPAKDEQVLHDERRYDVPITVISTTMTAKQLDEWTAQGVPYFAELPHMKGVTVVELPTSHWPQFTKPAELAQAILDAVG